MNVPEAAALMEKVRTAVHAAVVGREQALDQIAVGLLADGHLLLEDLPGLGKTLIAKSYARALGLAYQRIQFTADLLPHDILGTEILDRNTTSFTFRPGPLFANLILADEINRAPPKVQSALLEAMQEYQVTSERSTHALDRPFLVLATQNPIELEGTYPLPEAQVDRFLLRLKIGYPTVEEEREILVRRKQRRKEEAEVPVALDKATFLEMQRTVESVEIESTVEAYAVDIVRLTRADNRVEVGASPRGSLALLRISRASALAVGRDYVVPDDIKRFAESALAHRITIKPEPWIRGIRGEDVVRGAIERTPVPKVR